MTLSRTIGGRKAWKERKGVNMEARNKIKSLGLKRAEEQGDCRLCGALEVLEELVVDIKSGNVAEPDMVYVAMKIIDKEDDKFVSYPCRCAGGIISDFIGILNIHSVDMAASTLGIKD